MVKCGQQVDLARNKHELGLRRRLLRAGEFRHGVAAGAPGQRGAMLWTRVAGFARTARGIAARSSSPSRRSGV